MRVIDGDLLDVESGIIAHQTNCMGVMGAGVAVAIRRRWPQVYNEYRAHCREQAPHELLGQVQIIGVAPHLFVANVFGQLGTGSGIQTNYRAVAEAVTELGEQSWYAIGTSELYVPYGMGCGLAGGDWEAYSTILDLAWARGRNGSVERDGPEVTACRLRR